jgi:hypothetical protein
MRAQEISWFKESATPTMINVASTLLSDRVFIVSANADANQRNQVRSHQPCDISCQPCDFSRTILASPSSCRPPSTKG